VSGLFCAAHLSVVFPSVANVATVFDSLGIVMCPVHEAAQVIPFIHAPNLHAIAHTNRNAFGQVDVVCDEQRYAVTNIEDETLVTRTVIVIRQQSRHNALDLDPGACIALVKTYAQATPFWFLFLVRGRQRQSATKNAANHPWSPRILLLMVPF